VRREALHSLQSLLEKFPARHAAPAALLATIEKVAPRAADEDRGVRQALLSLLTALAEIVTPARLAPYFPLLLVHTCSAMTKLDSGVRLDSLHLVDLWLEHFPQLVVRYGARLLHNFLHLVSSEVGGGGSSSGGGGAGRSAKGSSGGNRHRTLSTNPMSRLATMQGRMAVLRRLLLFMELALKSSQQGLSAGAMGGSRGGADVTRTKTVEIPAAFASDKPAVLAVPSSVFAIAPCTLIFAGSDEATNGGHVDLAAMTAGATPSSHESKTADANQLSPATLLNFVSHDLLPVLVRYAWGR
jgi:hypothetical protein